MTLRGTDEGREPQVVFGIEVPWSEKRAEWDKRRGFARGYLARGQRDERGQRLDPVLEAHLGLRIPGEDQKGS
jgi:hypothetical protein